VVQFRLWLDAARVAFVLFFQLGGTITFALFGPSFPCNNIGSETDCRHTSSTAIVGGWTLSSILLLYAFCLAIMSYVPPPQPPPNPEAALLSHIEKRSMIGHSPTSSTSSETWLLKPDGRRKSLDTFYCQGLFRTSSYGASSLSSHQVSVNDRSSSPVLSHLSKSSSMSSSRRHAQSPSNSYPSAHQQIMPNPFADPISRYTSPMSVFSVNSSNHNYTRSSEEQPSFIHPYPRSVSLTYDNHRGPVFPPPPYAEPGRYAVPRTQQVIRSASPDSITYSAVSNTPLALRPATPSRGQTASPGIYSVRSMSASLHTPSRSASYSTSRAPSPLSLASPGLPASPRPAALLSLPKTNGVAQIRRYDSEPDLNLMAHYTGPVSTTLHTKLPSDALPPRSPGLPDWVATKSNRIVDFRQWRQNVLGAANGHVV